MKVGGLIEGGGERWGKGEEEEGTWRRIGRGWN